MQLYLLDLKDGVPAGIQLGAQWEFEEVGLQFRRPLHAAFPLLGSRPPWPSSRRIILQAELARQWE